MIPLAGIEERSFSDLDEVREHLSKRNRFDLELPLKNVSIDDLGAFRAGKAEGRLTEPAMRGLARQLRIPEGFVRDMPADLFTYTVGRLVRDRDDMVRIHTEDDLVTGIMPGNYLPVRHELVAQWLKGRRSGVHATLSPTYMRVTLPNQESAPVLPGDMYQSGSEIVNHENGLGALEVRQYVLRLVCLNGLVTPQTTASYSRQPHGDDPVSRALEEMARVVNEPQNPTELEKPVRWAADRAVGGDLAKVVRFLAARLEGETTRSALNEINEDSTWYALLNSVTAFARSRPAETRRRYEVIGGLLLGWFMREGRGHAPWRRRPCEHCTRADEIAN